tara:strand:+ start:1617 stop:2663 length:1047 start_codon:yes stop_codon:yes gene_type:complete
MSEETESKAGSLGNTVGGLEMESAIDNLLMDPSKEEEKPEEQPTPEEDVEPETIDTKSEAEEEEVGEEESDEESEDEVTLETDDTTDEDEEDVPEPEEDIVYHTEDGSDVTLEELKRGYLRQSDYTKKTQEVAEGRKNLEASGQQLAAHQDTLAMNLEMALNVVEPQLAAFAKTDWEALATQDPYEYAEKRALFDQAQIRYSHIQKAGQELVAQDSARKGQAKQAMLASERQKLHMALPDMADPVLGQKLAGSIKDYALGMGLTQEEAGGITDHRLIVALNKARMYDELNNSGLTASRKKMRNGPKKVIKGGQPVSKSERTTTAKTKLRTNLKTSGSVDDAVALLLGG